MQPTFTNQQIVERYSASIDTETTDFLESAVASMVATKNRGGKIVVVTGSGPNVHEGVTTLIAEMMTKGLIDGVTTSSAVIAHEMAGTLDRVKRIDGRELGIDPRTLPKGFPFEFTEMTKWDMSKLRQEMIVDDQLITRGNSLIGDTIIKAAGNMAYPMGLRTEHLAREILSIAQAYGLPFEKVAGWGADPRTMIGAGARHGLPVLVSVPQLVGGGGVGLSIADSTTITERCMRVADMISSAAVIIESAVALTQEIHDGPFEVYTGHGIWANWTGYRTYSLEGKHLVRIDLDPNLRHAWKAEKHGEAVQVAINQGLPKTKTTGIPFRMEMSGFARIEGSLPLVGDIGIIWPVLACKLASRLNVKLDFISHPQQTPDGKKMREWIVDEVKPVDRELLIQNSRNFNLQKDMNLTKGKSK